MSLGASNIVKNKVTTFERFKKVLPELFVNKKGKARLFSGLFAITYVATLIGLFVNHSFSVQYYVALSILAVIAFLEGLDFLEIINPPQKKDD